LDLIKVTLPSFPQFGENIEVCFNKITLVSEKLERYNSFYFFRRKLAKFAENFEKRSTNL
jgi:hypothetical protein